MQNKKSAKLVDISSNNKPINGTGTDKRACCGSGLCNKDHKQQATSSMWQRLAKLFK